MSEGRTEREALLEARIKELKGAQAKSAVTIAQGGMFESVWQTINSIVPPWLAAVALAVLLAHYGFSYYLQGQLSQAETQLKQAKADVETAKSIAANAPADASGVPIRLKTVKAQMEKTVAEAAGARATATALKVQVNGETVALQKAKAELDSLQNQARLAQAKADAESARFGLSTLQDRAVRAKLITQKLETIRARMSAAMMKVAQRIQAGDLSTDQNGPLLRAECEDNEYAELIGCPSQFLQQNRPRGDTPQQGDNPQLATAPSEDDGRFWKIPNSGIPAWRYFQNEAKHGAFAVTKYLKGGGFGYSWAPNRPIEDMRREALGNCAKQGADCKIIGEK
jgi:hypothetical protein